MPRLLLLRHAEAVPHNTDDFNRELSPRGRNDAVRLGFYLRSHGLFPDVTLASPSRRTRQTAELALAALPHAEVPLFDKKLYDASASKLRAAIAAVAARTLLVVGHNPGLAELAISLAASDGATSRLPKGFPTCTLVIFETPSLATIAHAGQFRLSAAVTPDMLSGIGGLGG